MHSFNVHINLKDTKMNKTIRTTVLAALVATAGAIGFAAPSSAQTPVAIGSTTTARLFPTTIPYVPNTVPADCLAYSLSPGARPIVFCENMTPTRSILPGAPNVTATLFFGGYKPWGWRTPDDCVSRKDLLGRAMVYCKQPHWGPRGF